MIISIWNNGNDSFLDKSKVLTVLMAAYGAMAEGESFTLVENSPAEKMISSLLFGEEFRRLLEDHDNYFSTNKYYLRKADNAVAVLGDQIYYIPQQCGKKEEVFDRDFVNNMYEYRENAMRITANFMIATKNTGCGSFADITYDADIIIAVLPFDTYVLTGFMDNYHDLRERCIIVSFCDAPSEKVKVIRKSFLESFYIRPDRFITIPYSDELTESVKEGKLVNFVERELKKRKEGLKSEFIKAMDGLYKAVKGARKAGKVAETDNYGLLMKRRYDFFDKR